MIHRHGQPGKYDQLPYKMYCKVKRDKEFDVYLQLSLNVDNPRWEYVGSYPMKYTNEEIRKEVEVKLF